MDDQSSEPFLEKSREDAQHEVHERCSRCDNARSGRSLHWKLAASHILIMIIYTAIFAYLIVGQVKAPTAHSLLYSPASNHIKYKIHAVDGLQDDSIFAGPPNPESDQAWHDLMEGINMRVSHEEMGKLGQKSLHMADGSGQLGTLGVYHELHCIKRIRKWFYRDYYYHNETQDDINERKSHADHCIELLRQASICKGDTSVTSFEWLHRGRGLEPTTKEGTPHQCVDWELLSGFAKERAVNLFDPKLLIKPDKNE